MGARQNAISSEANDSTAQTLAHPGEGSDSNADPIPEPLHDLLQSLSLFGRILLTAGFHTAATNRYDAGQAACFCSPEVDAARRQLRSELFARWLEFPLERQRADIEIYFKYDSGPAVPTATQASARSSPAINSARCQASGTGIVHGRLKNTSSPVWYAD
jgi:hypothetical protein